jgi:TonB-dependent SusC/RagA subfamily outer membrane receptor
MRLPTRGALHPLLAAHRSARSALALLALIGACAHSAPRTGDPQTLGSSVKPAATDVDLQASPNEPAEKYLQARSAGVVIGRTSDGNLTITIRGGSSSMNGNNAPLYIVDGVPFAPSSDGGLSGINPYDISSIRVLKDATDITMYGVRGANGVIVIKTKSSR